MFEAGSYLYQLWNNGVQRLRYDLETIDIILSHYISAHVSEYRHDMM